MYDEEFDDLDGGGDVLNSCGSIFITWFYLVCVKIQMQKDSTLAWGKCMAVQNEPKYIF